MKRRWLTVDSFSSQAKGLRDHFDMQFADPLSTKQKRFVWDYWHVPEQYTVLRTPAYHYFPSSIYQAWHRQLVTWGRENLGCHDVSPPWLSCYVNGCGQEMHVDQPHGPWAFVFSLTPWSNRKFSGGETWILKPESEWSSFELKGQTRLIEPKFNRLVVFDPSDLHGVRPVQGTQDPRRGRLVIHGWFVQPRPFVQGGRSPRLVERDMDVVLKEVAHRFEDLEVKGQICLRLDIAPTGRVLTLEWLTNTLKGPGARFLPRCLGRFLTDVQFSRSPGRARVTLPIRFGL